MPDEKKKKRWEEVITSTDLPHQLQSMENNPKPTQQPRHHEQTKAAEGDTSMVYPFNGKKYTKWIATRSINKTACIDDILVEQLNKSLSKLAQMAA